MNRNDILRQYRDRIQNHDRTKLTQNDTQALIEAFIQQLQEVIKLTAI